MQDDIEMVGLDIEEYDAIVEVIEELRKEDIEPTVIKLLFQSSTLTMTVFAQDGEREYTMEPGLGMKLTT